MLVLKFFILLASVSIGYLLGYLFTETKYRLAKWEVFQFKLFECRKCLSTHIAWITSTFFALLFKDWIMFAIGIFFAAMLFVGLLIDEKDRYITIEEARRQGYID